MLSGGVRGLERCCAHALAEVARYYKQNRNVSNIGVSVMLAAAICGTLFVATPVAAVQLTIPNLPGAVYFSTVVTFDAQVDIESDEAIPIQSIRVDATGPATAWVTFDPDGAIVSQSGAFAGVTVIDTPYYGAGYGYASGFGYDSSTGLTGLFSETWGNGFGYGYGATDPSHRTTRATYRITLNTASLALGTYNVQLSVNVPPAPTRFLSSVYTFNVLSLYSGGGGGGGTSSTPTPTEPPVVTQPGTVDLTDVVNDNGAFQQPLVIKDSNTTGPVKQAEFTVSQNTVGLTKDGQPLSEITMAEMTQTPPAPANRAVIGLPYNFGPDGATFAPPAEITFTYDPASLPAGVTEANLVAAYFDAATNAWVELPTVIDPVTHTVTAKVAHFTAIGVIGKTAATSPTPGVPQPPAAFKMGTLVLSAPEVNPDEKVEISAIVSNTGGVSGTYTVTFKVNGVAEATKELTIAAGGNEKVAFSTARSQPGAYTVDVNGLIGAFTVKAATTTGDSSSLTPVVTLVLLLLGISAAILAYFIWRRHKNQVS